MSYVGFRLTAAQLEDGVYVVSVRGDLDLPQTPEVERELEALQEKGHRHLIVDLLDVPFLESSVVWVLVRHSRRLRMNGGVFTVVSDNDAVTSEIDRHLHGDFRITSTLSQALADTAVMAT